MSAIPVNVPPGAGNSDRWGEALILRPAPDGEPLVLDLSRLQFADPLFLARLRAFMDWHDARGHQVVVRPPERRAVRNYLARMGIGANLPPGCSCDLGTVTASDRGDVLIPVTRLRDKSDSDGLDESLGELLTAHFTGELGRLAEPFAMTVGEMCDNATTHGQNLCGAYVVAQRYQKTRCVLTIGDVGIGIPEHMRQQHPHLTDDGAAIAEATKELVSGTGDPHRGVGYDEVITTMRESRVARGDLRVWAGQGRFAMTVRRGEHRQRRGWSIEDRTEGTWVRLELATR